MKTTGPTPEALRRLAEARGANPDEYHEHIAEAVAAMAGCGHVFDDALDPRVRILFRGLEDIRVLKCRRIEDDTFTKGLRVMYAWEPADP